jgi:hypothetical protein
VFIKKSFYSCHRCILLVGTASRLSEDIKKAPEGACRYQSINLG